MRILQASRADFAGIIELHRKNHIDSINRSAIADGFVTATLTKEQLNMLLNQAGGVTIAKQGSKVVAFAMAGSWDFWQEWPFSVQASTKLADMNLHGRQLTRENSYKYGPVCVDKAVRGSGIFERLFWASLTGMANRYAAVTAFIDVLNHRSYAAHTRKVDMNKIGTFSFKQSDYHIMARSTALVT